MVVDAVGNKTNGAVAGNLVAVVAVANLGSMVATLVALAMEEILKTDLTFKLTILSKFDFELSFQNLFLFSQ